MVAVLLPLPLPVPLRAARRRYRAHRKVAASAAPEAPHETAARRLPPHSEVQNGSTS